MKYTRRSVLRGILAGSAVSVGLPVLECFLNQNGTAFASGNGFPLRFGLFFWGNGNLPDRWTPTGEGTEWTLSDQLAPLADVKDLINVVTGMNIYVPNIYPHTSGAAGILSGGLVDTSGGSETFELPTIDQIVAQEIGGETRFKSLEVGAQDSSGLSYNGPYNQNPIETSPFALFERLFGAGFRAPGDAPIIDPTIGLRRSVLDAVVVDANRLQQRLGYSDRIRMEQYLEGIRAIEFQLAKLEEDPPNLAACVKPGEPDTDYPDIDGRPQLSAKHRATVDLLTMSLACDQTRVFSDCFSAPVNNVLFPSASAGHHQLTHDEPNDQPGVHDIILQIMAEFNYLISRLQSIEEGDGTLLDNCAVLGTSEISFGRTHSLENIPILTAGAAGGALRQGIHYHSPTGENTSKVMLSLIQSLGLSIGSFGKGDALASSGLPAILV